MHLHVVVVGGGVDPIDVAGVIRPFPTLDRVGVAEVVLERSHRGNLCRRLRWGEMGVLGGSLLVLHYAIGLIDLGRVAFRQLMLES